ncbi:hypothetical protein GT037_004562 [Alternaria burnsii]|uniref:Uncharacterized protein n=1 Tax=Alternaria burnsii TaxID=1187904 RepID=A0A8H7BE47_9PLEO|nr:uncharacterized protein GT037_004562 [Alternaria burnsii]KAF7677703.1 hypothetical protein GT037_004562 [Alternaria burnsii]
MRRNDVAMNVVVILEAPEILIAFDPRAANDLFRVLLKCDETRSMSGRIVGRHALMIPVATSTTHQVHAVAKVPVVSAMSNCMIVVKRYMLAKRTLRTTVSNKYIQIKKESTDNAPSKNMKISDARWAFDTWSFNT